MKTATYFIIISITTFTLIFAATAQENKDKKDPTAKTNIMTETLNKIRNVDQLDKYVNENTTLKGQNKALQAQIASLTKQVAKLTNDLKIENERMKKQLLQLPSFQLKSKLVGAESSIALLQHGDRTLKIRDNTQMSVLVKDGVWVLMKVVKITKDTIELSFPELDRTIILYD